ncbi:MAG TPA: dienelactone hydrolase family protein [Pelomicrobium sp.]|nr:dienelactone hydrolase family protein [Pelomicrobium sp.]
MKELTARIADGAATLEGVLALPERAAGIVAFAHGSGSSRFSPRNVYVAGELHRAGVGTLLFDLLTAQEDRDYATRFDIALLTRRLLAALAWLRDEPAAAGLPLGCFGASTGAAAALCAAAEDTAVAAVVSRGGRPDLAGDDLPRVRAPTLLIVGGADYGVIELNEAALARLRCEKELVLVPGATHLFEEPGTLEQAARHAADWFRRHFAAPAR